MAGNQNWNTQVQGTDVDFPLIRAWPLGAGAFFTPQDVATASKVAVLGSVVRDQLFQPDSDPIGQVMAPPPRLIGVHDSVEAARIALATDDALLVTDGGKPVGVVTRSDLLAYLSA